MTAAKTYGLMNVSSLAYSKPRGKIIIEIDVVIDHKRLRYCILIRALFFKSNREIKEYYYISLTKLKLLNNDRIMSLFY